MARFSVLIFALALLLSSADGWARDQSGSYINKDNISCGYYLDAYSRATLEGDSSFKGNYEAWRVFAWINGYLSAYNRLISNGKEDILG